nr:hypothetical protein [uncultured Draconibacterium sp.]
MGLFKKIGSFIKNKAIPAVSLAATGNIGAGIGTLFSGKNKNKQPGQAELNQRKPELVVAQQNGYGAYQKVDFTKSAYQNEASEQVGGQLLNYLPWIGLGLLGFKILSKK